MNSTLVCWRKVNPVLHNKAFSLGSPARSPPCLIKNHTHTHRDHQQELLSPEEHVDLTTVSGVINHLLLAWFINPLESSWFTEDDCEIRATSPKSRRRESHIRKAEWKWTPSESSNGRRAEVLFIRLLTAAGEPLCLKSAVIIYLVTASPTGETDHLPHQERKWLKRRPGSIVPSEERHSCAAQGQFFQERFGCARVCVWSN